MSCWGPAGLSVAGKASGNEYGGVKGGHKLKEILQNNVLVTACSRTQNEEPLKCVLVLRLVLFYQTSQQ